MAEGQDALWMNVHFSPSERWFMNQGVPNILVVEEELTVCSSLEKVLRPAGYDVEVFCSVEKFLTKSVCDGIGCVLLSFYMSGYSGLELFQQLKASGFSLPLIFLSSTSSVPQAVQAMKCGATDFLSKPIDWKLLLLAVEQAVARSRRTYQERAEMKMLQRLASALTPREMEVFQAVTTGFLNKQIAEHLGIGEKTIKVHRGRVMKKMQARSVAELVRLADKLKVDCQQEQHPMPLGLNVHLKMVQNRIQCPAP